MLTPQKRYLFYTSRSVGEPSCAVYPLKMGAAALAQLTFGTMLDVFRISSQSHNNHPEAREKRAGDKVIFPSTASELYLLQLTFFSLPASRLTVAKVRLSHTQKELLMPGTLLLDGFVRAMKMLCSGG